MKAELIKAIDADLVTLTALRASIESIPETADTPYRPCCPERGLGSGSGLLIQLFPFEQPANTHARRLASHFGTNWRRDGDGSWRGDLHLSNGSIQTIILHNAETPSTPVSLAEELARG
jgi:hypothetical protein